MRSQTPTLRPIVPADLAVFFAQQLDPVANQMAAFTAADPSDRPAFDAHWQRILSDATIVKRSIFLEEVLVGHILSYVESGAREVCYWLGRAYWGQGLASAALALFLAEMKVRPLHARAASDNLASIAILERAGFVRTGTEQAYASARGAEIEETLFRLDR